MQSHCDSRKLIISDALEDNKWAPTAVFENKRISMSVFFCIWLILNSDGM